jgi:hypothetical protein
MMIVFVAQEVELLSGFISILVINLGSGILHIISKVINNNLDQVVLLNKSAE